MSKATDHLLFYATFSESKNHLRIEISKLTPSGCKDYIRKIRVFSSFPLSSYTIQKLNLKN